MDPIQYAIDFAASMSGGSQTIAELDSLTAGFREAGKGSDTLRDAMNRITADLDGARAASLAANKALAEGTDEYRLLEKAVVQAQKAFEKASIKGVVTPEVAAAVEAATSALDKQRGQLAALEAAANAAAAGEARLMRTQGNLRTMSDHINRSFAQNSEQLSKMQAAFGVLGGPVGRLGQSLVAPVKGFEALTASMGASNAVALATVGVLALVVVGVVALAAAAVAGAVSVARWAISLGDSARSAGLAREAVEALRPELVALRGTFEEVSGATGVEAAALRDLQKSLADAKVSAAEMPAALRAAALAEAALGKGGSADFIARVKDGRLAVADFAATAERSFGGIVARQMLGLEAQSARLRVNLRDTFGSLNIEPALLGLQTLVGLFDKTSATGQAMRFLFESIFQPLIDQAENAAYVVEAFAIGMLIGLTKIYIAIKPAIEAVAEFLGFDDIRLTDALTLAKNAGEFLAPVIAVLAAGFASLVVVVGLVTVGFGVFLAALVAVGAVLAGPFIAAFYLAAAAWDVLKSGADAALEWFRGLPKELQSIGGLMIQGLITGITGPAGAVIGAIVNVVGGAIAAAKRTLGIASPSKVFAGLGEFTGEGFVEGLDGMTGETRAAMNAMVDPPETPLAAQDALAGNLGGGAPTPMQATAAEPAPAGNVIDLRGAQITIGGKDAPSGIKQFAEMLTKCLEGDAAMLGVEVLVDG